MDDIYLEKEEDWINKLAEKYKEKICEKDRKEANRDLLNFRPWKCEIGPNGKKACFHFFFLPGGEKLKTNTDKKEISAPTLFELLNQFKERELPLYLIEIAGVENGKCYVKIITKIKKKMKEMKKEKGLEKKVKKGIFEKAISFFSYSTRR